MKQLRSSVGCAVSIWFVGTTILACDGSGSGGSGDGGSGGTANDGCAMSLCGCWAEATMTFGATVQDATTMMPLSGIELLCLGETMPIAVSDGTGALSFSIQTQSSPGCGFERCNNMKLHDPSGVHTDLDGTYFSFNSKTLPM